MGKNRDKKPNVLTPDDLPGLWGGWRHHFDAKGRISIPAQVRHRFLAQNETVPALSLNGEITRRWCVLSFTLPSEPAVIMSGAAWLKLTQRQRGRYAISCCLEIDMLGRILIRSEQRRWLCGTADVHGRYLIFRQRNPGPHLLVCDAAKWDAEFAKSPCTPVVVADTSALAATTLSGQA